MKIWEYYSVFLDVDHRGGRQSDTRGKSGSFHRAMTKLIFGQGRLLDALTIVIM